DRRGFYYAGTWSTTRSASRFSLKAIMSTTHTIVVNGQPHQVTVDHYETPLLYVLREDLGLKGTRFGCGNGGCGSCTVLVDGHGRRSCELPIWSIEGKSITTIEGLGTLDQPHFLQRAFVDFQAGQCGYCLSGIIMTAAELIGSGAQPLREKIVAALDANLCRCGAHARIVKAIEAAWKASIQADRQ
ncbi:MAG TPA: 2Fe-2S iron-sulfur cluster-binding protein, partial [Candidatus Binataceae bacterium]|nr:2Fe-2S iron-sulfur cluster-binding protein [Candidatus Binataceae bacterium]